MKEAYNQGKEPERNSGEISNENSSLGSFQTTSVPDSSTSFPPSFPPSPKSDFNQDVSQAHSQLTERKTNKTLTTILIIIILLLLLLGAGYLYMQGFFSPDKEKKDKQTTEEVKADFSNMGDKAESSRTIGNVNDYSLGLITGGKERIHITEDGDIGIGTVNPGGLLGIGNNNTYITLDSQGNLTFTDTVSGTVKLSDLVSEEEETSETTKEELPIQQTTTTTSTTVDYGDHRNEGYLKESEYNDGGEKKGKDRELGNKDKYDLEIITNNKTRLFVDKSGFIGIGTTDPDHLLDVDGNIGLGRDSYLNFGSEDGSDGYGIRDNNGNVQFKNKNGSWTDVGAGGIGTETDPTYSSSPASGVTNTDINNWDTAYGWGDHSTAGYAETFLDLTDTPLSYTAGSILFTDNSSVTEDNNNLYWDNINKRLGIGTVSPSGLINAVSKTANANLHLHGVGDSHNYADIGLDQIDALGTTLTSWNITHRSEAGKDHNLEFLYYDGSDWIEPLIIDNNGNVGIGTTNPTQRLELHNDTEAAIALISSSAENKAAGVQLSADNGNSFWTFGAHHVDDKFVISDSSIATGDHLVINSNGNVGIGTTNPNHLLDVNGNIGLATSSYINWGSTDGSMGYGFRDNSGTIEYKNNSGSWTAFDSLINPSLWTDGTNGYYSNTEGIIVGPDTTETLDNTGFSLNAGDLFVSDQLGVEGNIYTDGSFIAGNTLTLTDGSISQSTGLPLNINLGGNSGDDLLIDTDTLVVESDNNRVGINTTDPEERFTINGGNYLHKAGDPTLAGSLIDSTNMDNPYSVYVSGKYAYVAGAHSDSLAILDISDPASPTLAGSLSDSTNMDYPHSVYVSGKYAYVAGVNSDSLAILDISDPASPTLAGSLSDSTNMDGISSVYVFGEYAYVVGSTSNSLAIVDISNPISPTLAGSLSDSTNMDNPHSVYVSGKYAYVTGYNSDSLAILDISDPTSPTLAGSLSESTNMDGANSVYVSGKYAYVAGVGLDSLTIIDISNPTSPTLAGSLSDSVNMDGANSVYVSGKYAYVAGVISDSLAILDISGIQAPAASIGNIATNSINVTENASIANDLYVNNGLMVGTGGILSSNSITTTEDLYLNGGEIYLTGITSSSSTTEGTIYYDNDDDNLYVYANGGWVDLTVQGGGTSLWTDGTNGYFSNTEGIIVGPDTTETLSNADFSLNAGDLFVSDQLGVEGNIYTDGSFIAGNTLTLTDGSISQSTGLPLNINLGGNVGDDLIIDTDTLVVESDNNRVGINTTDPEERFTINGGNYLHKAGDPVHVGSITDDGVTALDGANDVFVQGKYAYIASFVDSGLEILDISDPTNPTHVGAIDDAACDAANSGNCELDGANGVYVVGKYAYVVSKYDDGLEIVDISNPTNPTHAGAITDNGVTALDGANEIYVSGKYAYVTGWYDNGLEIIDISDPTNPTHVGVITDDGTTALAQPWGVFVFENYAYVASAVDDGLEILDISDPTNPTHVGAIFDDAITALDGAMDVHVSGKYAYVIGEQDNGLEIIDISDPTNPTHVGVITDDGTTALGAPRDIFISGDYAYIAGALDDGLEIIDISDPINPTHAGVIIDNATIELDAAQGVYISGKYAYVASDVDDGLEILDISGIQAPAASIGNIATNSINVSENASIANDLYVNNGLMVGTGGILSSNSITTTEDLYINGGELYINGITSSSSTTEGTIYYDNDDDNLYVYADGSWVDLTVQGGGSSLWTDGTNGYYSNTEGIIVGPDTTETLFNTDFSLNAGDLFVSDQLGVEGNIYTDGSFIAGNTLTLTDGSISQSTGLPLNINLGGSVGDDLIIDTDTLVVESDNNRVGINTTDPEERFTINGGNYLHKAGDPVYVGGIVDDGVMELGGAYGRIFVQGKYAYVTGIDDDGLEILDISDPTNPAHVGAIDDAACDAANSGNCELDGANGVFVVGKYAYVVAQADDGLEILDISDPTNPTHVGAIDNGICDAANSNQCRLNAASDIYISGKYAYVSAYNDDGLEIIDISDPTNPTHTGSIDDATCDAANSGNCELDSSGRVVVSGDYAYVTGYYDDGLEIIDISDPTNPTHAGSIADDATTALNDPIGLYVSGSYAYVASNIDDGLEIIDISDPTSPTHVGVITDDTTTALDGAFDVSVSGNYAYVASSADDNGIEVLDISDPTNPTHVGAIFDDETMTIGSPSNIYISGKYVYVAAGNPVFASDNGFGILDISGIQAPAATIGDLNTSTLDVTENASIANDLYVNNGLMVGTGGILSSGPTSTNTDLPTNYATTVKNDGNNTNRYGMLISAGEDTGSGTLIQFNDGDGTDVGEITFSGTTTTYGTSSDRRMKENIISTSMGIEDLMKVQVRDYEFKSDNTDMTYTGFIAQELIEVFPHAVFAPDDGRMWSVDYGKITPLLAKAIQDQQGMIDNLNNITTDLTTSLADSNTTNQEKFTIIGSTIEELNNDLSTKLNTQEEELNNQKTEIDNINNSLTTLTTTIENLNDLTSLMTDTLTNHEERIKNLESQISNLANLAGVEVGELTTTTTNLSTDLQIFQDNLTTELLTTTEVDPDTGEEVTTETYLFDVEGNLKAKEIEVAGITTDAETSGKAVIATGETEVIINSSAITENSKVYITLTSFDYGRSLYVDEARIIGGESFVVMFNGETLPEDVTFNWIIVK